MKKVGIITLHRVVNYGSVLQAYALQKKINEFNYDVEIIDYYPERLHLLGMLKRIKNKNEKLQKSFLLRTIARTIILPSYILRFNTFKKFLKEYVRLSEKTYETEEEFSKESLKYDIYCTGSDQVWNTGWNEKIDKPYYLSFAPNSSSKVAYAASFGKNKLDEWEKNETKQLLERYDFISLRELSGVDIVSSLGIENSINVLDPTLLLTGNEWRKLSSKRFEDEKYILVYNLNRNKEIDKYAKNLSKKTNLKVKYLSYQLHEFYKYGKMYCNPKVEDFLSLIDNAEYVITDSFHATAFSINFNTQFMIVFPKKYSTRVKSILEITNLQSRIAKDCNDVELADKKIDFSIPNNSINEERKKSIEYLCKILK